MYFVCNILHPSNVSCSFLGGMNLCFNRERFESFKSTYVATELLLEEMKSSGQILSYSTDNSYGEFLYNKETKTAVFLKFVAKLAKMWHKYKSKRNRPYKNSNDIANRLTTTTVGRNAIFHFVNNPLFNDFDLVVPAGNHVHETCLFVRKQGDHMKVICYNPNRSERTNGVEFNQVSVELMKMLGNKVESVKAYHAECGNFKGKCSVLCWEVIFSHVINGNSPFRNPELQLEDYEHFVFNHFKIWKDLDNTLCDLGVEVKEMVEVTRRFCALAYQNI